MTVKFSHEVHIVKNLKVKLLISMNILATEEVIINLQDKTLMLEKCRNVKALIQITAKDNVRVQ